MIPPLQVSLPQVKLALSLLFPRLHAVPAAGVVDMQPEHEGIANSHSGGAETWSILPVFFIFLIHLHVTIVT